MTDLLHVVPDFDTTSYSHILPSLERAYIGCNDILTLDAVDVAKRASIPSAEIRRLKKELVSQLQLHLGRDQVSGLTEHGHNAVSTLNEDLDDALSGGFLAGHLSEITGESAAGKTQFLLSLCLAVQLPAPYGLNRAALYITTEAPLQTTRLAQILFNNPIVMRTEPNRRPSLARVHSIKVPDLEAQEHILQYQLPVAIERHNVGLVIIDSVAANFRAEFDRGDDNGGHDQKRTAFAARTRQLITLGTHLRSLARKYNIAIVVANQVLDRFAVPSVQSHPASSHAPSQASQLSSRHSSQPLSPHHAGPSYVPQLDGTSESMPENDPIELSTFDPLSLDHQQRFTTGWGHIFDSYVQTLSYDDPALNSARYHMKFLKTPSLGQVWTSQLSARIVLLKSPIYKDHDYKLGIREMEIKGWNRWLSVVFAGWTADDSGRLGTGFEIWEGGLRAMNQDQRTTDNDDNT